MLTENKIEEMHAPAIVWGKPISNPVLPLAKGVKETTSMEEVVSLLSSGNWVAVLAVPYMDGSERIKFVLLRVC